MKFILVYFLILFSTNLCLAQTSKNKPNDWYLADYEKEGFYGISLEKAYTLLKGKKSNTVIVAVIDSGIDTLQEDLKPVFWTNPKEIPNNGIDDDKNGLIDDVHGWNYLGAANGENLAISVPDTYRTYQRFKKLFENKKESEIAKDQKYLFNEWTRAKKIILANYTRANFLIKNARDNYAFFLYANAYLVNHLKKNSFTKPELEKLSNGKDDSLALYTSIWKHIFDTGDFNNESFLKDYSSYLNNLEDDIRYTTTQPVNYRDALLKDNGYDISKTIYGNNNLQTFSGYHGTSVSGIIGAVRNNNKGVDGIADNVRIMMIRAILGKDEYDKDVALAIRYAVDHGAKVINMSFGKSISPDKKWVDDAIKYAEKNDVVLVHASGNDAQNIDTDFNYPNAFYLDGSRMPHFINVGASGGGGDALVADFTNYGKKMVDLMAPGVNIRCAIAHNGTQLSSGTSMASPVVAGIAALLRSYFPKLTAPQIVDILKKSGTAIKGSVIRPGTEKEKIPFSSVCATGKIVNAFGAVQAALLYK